MLLEQGEGPSSCSVMAGRNYPTPASSNSGARRRRFPCRCSRHVVSAAPQRRRLSRPTASSTYRRHDRAGRGARRKAGFHRRPVGRAGRLARRDVPAGYFHQGCGAERAAALPRPRPAAGDCAKAASPISTGSIFSRPELQKPVRARRGAHHAHRTRGPRLLDPSAHQFVEEGKGFLHGGDPARPLRRGTEAALPPSRRSTENPASAAD